MFKQLTKTVATAFSTDPLKEFKLNREASTPAGRHGLFSMCEAVERSTGKLLTVFSAKRKDLVQKCGGNEAEVDLLLEDMRKGIMFLSQLQHPSLLRIDRPLTVSGSLIYYVTERVNGFLPQINSSKLPQQLKKLELQHLLSGIRFLHERCNLLLLNFGPHSVYTTSTGWKIGDLCHCLLRDEAANFRPIRANAARMVTSPLIDYLADECLEPPSNSNNATSLMSNLFESAGNTDGPSSLFPSADTFSFLVTAGELLRETHMFHSGGDMAKRRQQVPTVTREIATLFPSVSSVCGTPRPPLATLAQSSCLFSEDIRLVLEIERMDPSEGPKSMSFDVLKAIYEKVGERAFCNEILQQSIIPFGLRAAKHQYMLRFVLPILMQCTVVLPPEEIRKELKEFFVMVIRGIANAASFEVTGVLAQQLLEKVKVIQDLFASPKEQSEVLVPFYIKCISSTQHTMVMLAIRALNQLLHAPTVASIKWPPRFVKNILSMLQSANEQEAFYLLIDILTTLLQHVSEKEKAEVEALLVKMVQTVFLTQQKRLISVLGVLNKLQQSMPLEHIATVSIPLLSPLLLSSHADVRNYAASVISSCITKFDAHPTTSIPSPNVPQGIDTWSKSPAPTAVDFTVPSGGSTQTSPIGLSGVGGSLARHYDAGSTVSDMFSMGTTTTTSPPVRTTDNSLPFPGINNNNNNYHSANSGGAGLSSSSSSTAQMWGNLASQLSSIPLDNFNTSSSEGHSVTAAAPSAGPCMAYGSPSSLYGSGPSTSSPPSMPSGVGGATNYSMNPPPQAPSPSTANDDDLMAAFGFS